MSPITINRSPARSPRGVKLGSPGGAYRRYELDFLPPWSVRARRLTLGWSQTELAHRAVALGWRGAMTTARVRICEFEHGRGLRSRPLRALIERALAEGEREARS